MLWVYAIILFNPIVEPKRHLGALRALPKPSCLSPCIGCKSAHSCMHKSYRGQTVGLSSGSTKQALVHPGIMHEGLPSFSEVATSISIDLRKQFSNGASAVFHKQTANV